MLRIAICDDDTNTASSIEDILRNEHYNNIELDVFSNGESLLQHISKPNPESRYFHIYLMDIKMPGLGGIETASAIRSMDSNAVIIFVTDYEEYVYEVFETLPFRFLRKPIVPEKLKRSIYDAISYLHTNGNLFFFSYQRNSHQLPYGEILYFESAGRKMHLHAQKEIFTFNESIMGVLSALDTSVFCRIHGSYVVNMEYIRSIRKNELVLTNDILLPVSKRYQVSLKKAHLDFIERRF